MTAKHSSTSLSADRPRADRMHHVRDRRSRSRSASRSAPRRAGPTSAASTSTPTATPPPARRCSTGPSPARSNVGLGRSVMPTLTTGSPNVAAGTGALISNTSGNWQRRHRQHGNATSRQQRRPTRTERRNVATGFARWHATRPATTTSPPARCAGSNTTGDNNVATGVDALRFNTTASSTSRPAPARWAPTRPATSTSPPATTRWAPTPPATTTSPPAQRAGLQHDRQQQRRHRPKRAARTRPATTTSPPASTPCQFHRVGQRRHRPQRRQEPDHRLEQRRHRQRRQGRRGGDDPDRHRRHADRHLRRRDQRHDAQRSDPAGGRQVERPARDRASSLGVHRIARGDRRAAAAPGRPASQAGEGRLIEAA